MERSTQNAVCQRCSQTHFHPSSFIKYFYPSRGCFEYDISMEALRFSAVEDSCSWCGIILGYVLDLLAEISTTEQSTRDTMITACGWTNSEFDLLNHGTGTVHIIVAIRDINEAQSFTEKLVEIWPGSGVIYSRYFSAVASPSRCLDPSYLGMSYILTVVSRRCRWVIHLRKTSP